MKPKHAIVIGFLAAVGVIMYLAVGHKPSRSSFEDQIAAMSGFKDRMCTCPDKPCAEKLSDRPRSRRLCSRYGAR